jgi:hypothetical protein
LDPPEAAKQLNEKETGKRSLTLKRLTITIELVDI